MRSPTRHDKKSCDICSLKYHRRKLGVVPNSRAICSRLSSCTAYPLSATHCSSVTRSRSVFSHRSASESSVAATSGTDGCSGSGFISGCSVSAGR